MLFLIALLRTPLRLIITLLSMIDAPLAKAQAALEEYQRNRTFLERWFGISYRDREGK